MALMGIEADGVFALYRKSWVYEAFDRDGVRRGRIGRLFALLSDYSFKVEER